MNENKFDVVYLGLQPVSSKSEGLNVLLCDTLKPMLESGVNVSIHTTNRHKAAIEEALIGNLIDINLIKINSYNIGSAVIPFLTKRSKRKISNNSFFEGDFGKFLRGLFFRPMFLVKEYLIWTLDASIYTLPLKLIMAAIFGLAMLPVMMLISLIIFILIIPYLGLMIVKSFVKKLIVKIRGNKKLNNLIKPIAKWVLRNLIREINHVLYEKEQIRFVNELSRKNKVEKLFFFTCFEGSAVKEFKGKSLVVFPDVVTAIFPMRFRGAHNKFVLDSIRKSVVYSSELVCYSNYVKNQQLLKIFKSDLIGKKISVIPQGYFVPKIKMNNQMGTRNLKNNPINISLKYTKNLFPDLMEQVPTVDFSNFSYILYPTVDRPHKNSLTLVRAFNVLLRKKYRNLKLVLTTPGLTAEVADYIRKNRLHYDIIIMPSVPIAVLDDLFMGASIMVHPSLAEGGDIFNFSRAVSVGCPALLADIPVVREMFDRKEINSEIYENWLFDPYDHEVLAEKIDKTLINSKEFVVNQIRTLEELSLYGYPEMAQRYLETYERL